MNNNRDMNPELDYFELRRRHEEFKSRQRMAKTAETEADEPSVRPASQFAPSSNAASAENIPEDIDYDQPEDFDAPDQDYDDGEYYDEAYDEDYVDEPEQDVNPFKTLFKLAKGAKNKLSGKREEIRQRGDGVSAALAPIGEPAGLLQLAMLLHALLVAPAEGAAQKRMSVVPSTMAW